MFVTQETQNMARDGRHNNNENEIHLFSPLKCDDHSFVFARFPVDKELERLRDGQRGMVDKRSIRRTAELIEEWDDKAKYNFTTVKGLQRGDSECPVRLNRVYSDGCSTSCNSFGFEESASASGQSFHAVSSANPTTSETVSGTGDHTVAISREEDVLRRFRRKVHSKITIQNGTEYSPVRAFDLSLSHEDHLVLSGEEGRSALPPWAVIDAKRQFCLSSATVAVNGRPDLRSIAGQPLVTVVLRKEDVGDVAAIWEAVSPPPALTSNSDSLKNCCCTSPTPNALSVVFSFDRSADADDFADLCYFFKQRLRPLHLTRPLNGTSSLSALESPPRRKPLLDSEDSFSLEFTQPGVMKSWSIPRVTKMGGEKLRRLVSNSRVVSRWRR